MAVNLHTTQYRFGIDELAESTHGWYAAQNTNPTANAIGPGFTFLLRFNVQETGGTAAGNTDFQFRVAKNGGAFQDITTGSTIVKAVDPAAWADAANCTQRVAGTGTFESSGAGCTIDGLSGGAANDIAASGCSETECGLQIVAADVKAGDTLTFALTSPDFTITNDVVPTLTLTAPPEAARESVQPAATARSFPQNRNQNVLSWALNLLQSTLAPVAEVATQLRGAMLSNPVWRQWRPESVFAVGLLLTTLAVSVVQAPLFQPSWPNPTAPTRNNALLTWVQGPRPDSIVNQFRLGPYESPNPSLGPARATELRTWIRGPKPDSIPNTALPFNQSSWPRPGSWRAQLTWAQGPNPETIPNPLPPGSLEWPKVPRAVPRLQPETWTRSTQLTLGVPIQSQPIPTGTQYDFPNPKRPGRSINLLTFVGRVAGPPAAAVTTLPDGKTAWEQNPRAPGRAFQSVLGGTNPAFIPAPAATLPVGGATEWIVPRPAPRAINLRVFAGRSLTESGVPFVQTEWPNPTLGPRRVSGFTQGTAAPLTIPLGPLPDGKQFQFTVPRAAPRAVQDFQSGSHLTFEPPPVPLPTGQISHSEFPNPRGAPRSAALLAGFIDSNRTVNVPPPAPAGTGYDIYYYYANHS